MIKKLSENEFNAAIVGIDIGDQTKTIAHGVLVIGKKQSAFVTALGLSKGAVSQAVSRVWYAHKQKEAPPGMERITAILPEHQAFIVKRWEEEAKQKGKK